MEPWTMGVCDVLRRAQIPLHQKMAAKVCLDTVYGCVQNAQGQKSVFSFQCGVLNVHASASNLPAKVSLNTQCQERCVLGAARRMGIPLHQKCQHQPY